MDIIRISSYLNGRIENCTTQLIVHTDACEETSLELEVSSNNIPKFAITCTDDDERNIKVLDYWITKVGL